MGVTSTLEGDSGEFSMKEVEFTALMVHQCAAVVAVNLQIDQTAEPKDSKPYLRVRAQTSRRLAVGVSDGWSCEVSTLFPQLTNPNTDSAQAKIISPASHMYMELLMCCHEQNVEFKADKVCTCLPSRKTRTTTSSGK